MEVEKLCRICLTESMELKPIFGYNFDQLPIMEVIRRVCCNMRFFPNVKDSLPKSLCDDCIDVLSRAYKLNDTCVDSEIRLQSMMSPEVFVKQEPIESVKFEEETYEINEENFGTNQDVDSGDDSDESVQDIKVDVTIDEPDDSMTSSDANFEVKVPNAEDAKKPAKTKLKTKKHECPTCSKFFDKPCRLQRHMKTHDVNKKPFACELPGCFQRFTTDASLKRHAIMHSGICIKVKEDRTFECVVCLKHFQVS